MRIIIVRHGDPDYEHDTLTSKGRREATLLAKRLGKEKIDYIYSSPLGRAKDTCAYTAKAHGLQDKVEIKDWLQEFNVPLTLPSGRNREIPWDMLSDEWVNNEKMYHFKRWYEQDFYRECGIQARYQKVIDGLDQVLAEHGYVRDGEIYKVEKSNRDTLVFFCHFGLEMVLLSHLCGISPIPLWHHFVALTSSVTTLYTEERRKGIALFRCTGFSDVGHLYEGGETPSCSARFCETFDSDERHD
jgi:probable phosphoglycerate mutase